MKKYKFIVVFTDHNYVEVESLNETEARILAQAEQIKKGLSYMISHVKYGGQ